MNKKKLVVLDFDDTVVKTTEHICKCYSALTGDEITNEDFLSEFIWDNVPRYKDVFRSMITAIQDDPSKLELMDGFKSFINKLNPDYIDIVILSKRTGLKQIRKYIESITTVPIKYALVKTIEEKIEMIERFHDIYIGIYLFEDRMDALKGSMLDYCAKVYMPQRAWNEYQHETSQIKKFKSYKDLIMDTYIDGEIIPAISLFK